MTTTSPNTGIERLNKLFDIQKKSFLKKSCPSAEERIKNMQKVADMMVKNRQKIIDALNADFGSHSEEAADLLEIIGMLERSKYNIRQVKKWMKPVPKDGNPITLGNSKVYLKYQPKGVIGNMVSWNFPFDIAIGPLLDAMAAGNKMIIKPSDLAPNCGKALQEMIAETFDEDEVAVVNGGLDLAIQFPHLAWDHLVYTGSGTIGKTIMKAAAENLVPVTLELGGKSPAIISEDSITEETIRTIAGVKVVKRGQMCVTIDYCLVPENQKDKFVDMLSTYMQTNFTENNAAPHACGIINDRHVARLQAMVDNAKENSGNVIQIGADLKPGDRNMPFYLVVDPTSVSACMKDEVFGPIMPIVTYKNTQDAIDFVNKGDKPLGLYIFSKNKNFIDKVTENTQSGGVAINIAALQAGQPSLPFGGVGASGMGVHHGVEAFREFSNQRGFFEKGKGGTIDWIMPPYGANTRKLIHEVAYAPISKQLKFALSILPKNILARFK